MPWITSPLLLRDAALWVPPSLPQNSSLFYWIISFSMQRFSSISHLKKQKSTTNIIPSSVFFLAITLWLCSPPGQPSCKRALSCACSASSSTVFSSVHLSWLPLQWSVDIALQGHQWPPFAKSGKHIFVLNFLNLSKALDKLTLTLKGSPVWLPWHILSCWFPAETTGLFSVPFASSLSLVFSFCWSCVTSPGATPFHPELQFQTSLSLSQACTFSSHLFLWTLFFFLFLFHLCACLMLGARCHLAISQVLEISHFQMEFWFSKLLLHDFPQFPVAPILIVPFPHVYSNSTRSRDSTLKYILSPAMLTQYQSSSSSFKQGSPWLEVAVCPPEKL